jgi:DNA-binding transcriptional MerR regulator
MSTAALSIGDFSRATLMSVKMLRHYHQIGLLEPADVDPDTRYRRYTVDQIPTAQVIRRFRELQMPLERIRDVLAAPDPATRNALIASHLDEAAGQPRPDAGRRRFIAGHIGQHVRRSVAVGHTQERQGDAGGLDQRDG